MTGALSNSLAAATRKNGPILRPKLNLMLLVKQTNPAYYGQPPTSVRQKLPQRLDHQTPNTHNRETTAQRRGRPLKHAHHDRSPVNPWQRRQGGTWPHYLTKPKVMIAKQTTLWKFNEKTSLDAGKGGAQMDITMTNSPIRLTLPNK